MEMTTYLSPRSSLDETPTPTNTPTPTATATPTPTGAVRHQLERHLRTTQKSLVWRGILAILIGVVSVAWPSITVQAFVILFAVYAFMAAITDAVRAFNSDGVGRVTGYLLLSVLSVIAGFTALVWPGITALALTLLVAAWAIGTGFVEVGLAFRRNETAGERAMWALGGLISIALGVVLAIRPDLGALTLATVFGLFSIVSGISALVLGARARRVTQKGHLLAEPTA